MTRRVRILLTAILAILVTGAAGFLIVALGVFGYALRPASARLVTDDLRNFEEARQHLTGTADSAAVLDRDYFSAATPGLVQYAGMYRRDGRRLTAALSGHPAFFDSLHDLRGRVEAQFPAIRTAYVRFDSLYPSAIFPPAWFVISGRGPGGANGYRGLYIGADTYGSRVAGEGPNSWVHATGELPSLVVHELTHFNQATRMPRSYFGDNRLIARAIKEGTADFVAELITGQHINGRAHQYGLANEARLWAEFSAVMQSDSVRDWFFRQPADSSRPPDLGYFIGYQIVAAWFRTNGGTTEAFRRLMRTRDYDAFLAQSGYSASGAP